MEALGAVGTVGVATVAISTVCIKSGTGLKSNTVSGNDPARISDSARFKAAASRSKYSWIA